MRGNLQTFLLRRSSVRSRRYQNRSNTWYSLAVLVAAAPLAIALYVVLSVRVLARLPRPIVFVLQIQGEFARLPEYLERVRGCLTVRSRPLVLILDYPRHLGFQELYGHQLGWRLVWPKGVQNLINQAFLLQPSRVVTLEYLWLTPIGSAKNRERPFATRALSPGPRLVSIRAETLHRMRLDNCRYVALAVFTRQYEIDTNPQNADKTAWAESIGCDLAQACDVLSTNGVHTVLLGSPDTGVSRVPRMLPRLSEFAKFGGPTEVALASRCEYFWTDGGVGAWWLSSPFRRPVLFTNCRGVDFQHYAHPPVFTMVLPMRLQSQSGREFTLREMLENPGLRKSAARGGDVKAIRNTSDEVAAANREMLARIDGTWREEGSIRALQIRAAEVFADFPQYVNLLIPSDFLAGHPRFLD